MQKKIIDPFKKSVNLHTHNSKKPRVEKKIYVHFVTNSESYKFLLLNFLVTSTSCKIFTRTFMDEDIVYILLCSFHYFYIYCTIIFCCDFRGWQADRTSRLHGVPKRRRGKRA